MRYDRTIYLCRRGIETYDDATGDYIESEPSCVKRRATIMDTRKDTMQLVYGEIRQGSLTVHIQNHYHCAIDYMMIDGIKYRIDYQRKLRTKHTYVVSEVQ